MPCAPANQCHGSGCLSLRILTGRWTTAGTLRLLSLLLLVLPAAAQAQYEYTVNGGGITITRYTGSGGAAVIPSTTNGLPVTGIGSQAFYNCDRLTSVTIPNSVTTIESSAFDSCTGLTDVTIPNNLTYLADYVFASCTSLTSVTIPDSVTSIGEYAFWDCGSLTTVTIPNNVTSIGSSAFQSCLSLISVTLGNHVAGIGSSAFWNCGGLTNVTIPNSVTSIGDFAFTKCSRLTTIAVELLNSFYGDVDGVLFNKIQTALIAYPAAKTGSYSVPDGVTNIGTGAFCYGTNLTSVVIPDSVTSIGYVAFAACDSLASVTIGNGVTSIGSSAFYNCSSLTNTLIPGSVTSIGWGAFRNCASLTSVTTGSGMTSLPEWTFSGCSNLTSVTIGSAIVSIGSYAFNECRRLTAVSVAAANSFYSSVDGVVFDKTKTTLVTYPPGRGGSYVVPNSVTNIGDGAFAGGSDLAGVYFQGNAPALGLAPFGGDDITVVYYLVGTTGWGPTFGGRPAVLWNPQVPTGDASFGVRTNRFGFTITGASGIIVAVEACTNLANPLWLPLETKTLVDGSCYFSDLEWTNQPARFYRLRSP